MVYMTASVLRIFTCSGLGWGVYSIEAEDRYGVYNYIHLAYIYVSGFGVGSVQRCHRVGLGCVQRLNIVGVEVYSVEIEGRVSNDAHF
jgi:hypothetical protein